MNSFKLISLIFIIIKNVSSNPIVSASSKFNGDPSELTNQNFNEMLNGGNVQFYDFNMAGTDDNLQQVDGKRSALGSVIARRSQKLKGIQAHSFGPNASLGVLTNLQGFFDQLKTNIETLETKPELEPLTLAQLQMLDGEMTSMKKEYVKDYHFKPSGSAAFLHAIRSYRPTQKIRALVAMEPESYRGSNFHDPNYLWAGLGKK